MTWDFLVFFWKRNQERTRVLRLMIGLIRHLPTLIQLDRDAHRADISSTDRRADFWGNLGALEAARTGAWR